MAARERRVFQGLARIGCGAAKLIILAVPVEHLIHAAAVAQPAAQTSLLAWLSMFAFSFQLYLVLSGVADIYLGFRRLFGRAVVEIFGTPFWATGFGDFWRQWNLAPINGASAFKHAAFNLLLVLLVVVIWRGVTWGTAVWAALHLVLLALEHGRRTSLFAPLPPPVRAVLVLAVVLGSGILLFLQTLGSAWEHMVRLFVSPPSSVYSLLLDAVLGTPWTIICLWTAGLVCVALPPLSWLQEQSSGRVWTWSGLAVGLVAALMGARHLPVVTADSPLVAVRHAAQWPLTKWFREGNPEVFVGHDGWLYQQREVQRLTLQTPGMEVTEALQKLTASLRAQSVPLLVVVVPGKAAMYPEFILRGEYGGPVNPATHTADLARLRQSGATVLDAADTLWQLKRRFPLYFLRDSHWTPEAMKAVAQATAKLIHEKWPHVEVNRTPMVDVRILDRTDFGDLAGQLAPWAPDTLWAPEQTQLVSILGLGPQADSPVLVLGNDLVQVFDDSELSFGGEAGISQQAGFVTQLAALLGRPLAVGPEVDPAGVRQIAESAVAKRLVIALVRAGDL